jgi:hypothetical protein
VAGEEKKMKIDYRKKLIDAGVRNLREFGYPACNAKNILTDYVFANMFIPMLEDNIGVNPAADKTIKVLKKECQERVKRGING